MMQDAIEGFAKQFLYKPVIQNKEKLKKKKRVIVLGMGGSHLAADLALAYDPSLPLTVHTDYGLPAMPAQDLRDTLVIASSYSGNTEEIIEGFQLALKQKLAVAAITVGGKLLDSAKQQKIPYVQMPDTGIQPRSALGFNLLGILAIMGESAAMKQAAAVARSLKPKMIEPKGAALARKLKDHVPVIYSSARNQSIAYNWKIKFNETGKIPGFYNVFSELNHNEMTRFDVQPKSRHLSRPFHFIFLKDKKDHPKIQKRMDVMKKLYEKRGLPVTALELIGTNPFTKIFTSLVLADWTALHTASLYGLEPEQVPMVVEFKKLIA